MSSLLLDATRYDDDSNNYKDSEIRNWLNNDFLNTAFKLGSSNIQTTVVDNSVATTYLDPTTNTNDYACDNTEDKVYLLSCQDYSNANYGYSTKITEESATRICKYSEYARARNAFMNSDSNGYYWTRSPSYNHQSFATVVYYGGDMGFQNASYSYIGVRPSITIKI